MTKYHIRNYLELFHILIYKNVSFDELRLLFHITANTFKKDLAILVLISECYGIRLILHDQSITYEITNFDLFSEVINECSAFLQQEYS